MTKVRAALFDEDDVDLSDFKVGQMPDRDFPSKDDVTTLSEQAGFPSREAVVEVTISKEDGTPDAKRKPYNSSHGQKVQLNIRVTRDVADAFYRIAKEEDWNLGKTMKKAVSALEQSLYKK